MWYIYHAHLGVDWVLGAWNVLHKAVVIQVLRSPARDRDGAHLLAASKSDGLGFALVVLITPEGCQMFGTCLAIDDLAGCFLGDYLKSPWADEKVYETQGHIAHI